MRHIIWRLSATETGAQFCAISRARARAAGSNSVAGRTWRTSPPSSASLAGKIRPVIDHSRARLMPTTRGKNQLEQASGVIPRRLNTKPIRACSLARRMSIGSSIVAPMPTAGPLMAAITGFRQLKMRKVTRPPPSRTDSSLQSIASPATPRPSSGRSLRAA